MTTKFYPRSLAGVQNRESSRSALTTIKDCRAGQVSELFIHSGNSKVSEGEYKLCFRIFPHKKAAHLESAP